MLGTGLCIKLISFVGSCISVPLIATALTGGGNSQVESIKVTEKGDKIGPIFNCQLNSKSYKVYLLLKEEIEDKNTITADSIGLQIIEKDDKGGKETIVWGPKVEKEKEWKKWELQVLWDESATILVPNSNQNSEGFGGTAICPKETNKVYQWRRSDYKKFLQVENSGETTKLEIQIDLGSCKITDNLKECDIKFIDSSPFYWNNFKPKITFPVKEK